MGIPYETDAADGPNTEPICIPNKKTEWIGIHFDKDDPHITLWEDGYGYDIPYSNSNSDLIWLKMYYQERRRTANLGKGLLTDNADELEAVHMRLKGITLGPPTKGKPLYIEFQFTGGLDTNGATIQIPVQEHFGPKIISTHGGLSIENLSALINISRDMKTKLENFL